MESIAAVAAVVAAVVAAGALWYSRVATRAAQLQVAAAEEQTKLQRQLRIDSAQPYVWVDIRPNDEHGQLLMLYLGNSGPTVATEVRATFEPAIELPEHGNSKGREATERLRRGVSSLPPGRVMLWDLGVVHVQVPMAPADGYQVTIEASGPFGPLEPLIYRINIMDFRSNLATPPGTLHGVAVAIGKSAEKLAKVIEAANTSK